ncbi:MAG: ATP-binding protein [bacterium]|nr:ATP-binding protein [bacterium]
MATHQLYPRFAREHARTALGDTPVVVLHGARQVGKSTLVAELAAELPNSTVLTLDDPVTLEVAASDPVFFVNQSPDGLLVIDEAQRAPSLILPLKASVDRDRRAARFLLTGSADLLHVKGVGDSLAGRAETIELWPLSQGELSRRATPECFIDWLVAGWSKPRFSALDPERVTRGGYPSTSDRSPERARDWLISYVERLADHDARDLQAGSYADHMRALLQLLAAGGMQELVKAKIARSLGIAESTVDAYLRMAQTMHLTASLPAWGRSARGRISRRPRVGLNDTGLSAALTGFTEGKAASVGGREYYGALVEQFVALELLKQRGWSAERYSLHHFRDLDGLEVDLIAELPDGRLVAIEVKASQTISHGAWRNLERFRERFADREITSVLLHGGTQVAHIGEWLHVLPIPSLWEH